MYGCEYIDEVQGRERQILSRDMTFIYNAYIYILFIRPQISYEKCFFYNKTK